MTWVHPFITVNQTTGTPLEDKIATAAGSVSHIRQLYKHCDKESQTGLQGIFQVNHQFLDRSYILYRVYVVVNKLIFITIPKYDYGNY